MYFILLKYIHNIISETLNVFLHAQLAPLSPTPTLDAI